MRKPTEVQMVTYYVQRQQGRDQKVRRGPDPIADQISTDTKNVSKSRGHACASNPLAMGLAKRQAFQPLSPEREKPEQTSQVSSLTLQHY